MKKIFIWCPFIDYVGTTISSKNSINALSKFGNKNFSLTVINVFGEWNFYLDNLKKLGVEVINLGINKEIPFFKKKGFFFSRLIYFKIFFLGFFPLLKILKKREPDYLIVSLVTFLPLIINYIFKIKTKIILRISGFPKLNFLRLFFWKIMLSKIEWVFSPTIFTNNMLKKKFPAQSNKIKMIRDPIFSYKEILEYKKKHSLFKKKNNFYLAVGRLTKQKNFKFLVNAISKYNSINKKKINVLVLGDGEEKNMLKLFSKKLNINRNIKFLGFKRNTFKYFFNAKALICTSLWEDPGFILIESGIANLPIISNSCLSGPIEILNNEKNGYLYKFNSTRDLISKIKQFENDDQEVIFQKKVNMKIYSRKFSILKFYKNFIKYV